LLRRAQQDANRPGGRGAEDLGVYQLFNHSTINVATTTARKGAQQLPSAKGLGVYKLLTTTIATAATGSSDPI